MAVRLDRARRLAAVHVVRVDMEAARAYLRLYVRVTVPLGTAALLARPTLRHPSVRWASIAGVGLVYALTALLDCMAVRLD